MKCNTTYGSYLMQRAKLFGALYAYVNNIQITWKTIHLSVFCRTNSPSTDQSRAEGNNTECVGIGEAIYIRVSDRK
jgi:hypothetical protein